MAGCGGVRLGVVRFGVLCSGKQSCVMSCGVAMCCVAEFELEWCSGVRCGIGGCVWYAVVAVSS